MLLFEFQIIYRRRSSRRSCWGYVWKVSKSALLPLSTKVGQFCTEFLSLSLTRENWSSISCSLFNRVSDDLRWNGQISIIIFWKTLLLQYRRDPHTLFEKSNFCPKIQFWQNLNIFTSFSPKIFLTIFLVKSKLSTAKKSNPPSKKKIDIFFAKLKLNFWTKNEDFEQCGPQLSAGSNTTPPWLRLSPFCNPCGQTNQHQQ